MPTQSTTEESLKGTCSFCKGEFDKRKMTQHLKYCKQRASDIAAEAEDATKQKTRLFHLVVEGHYNPQYWMHLEVPTSEPLATVDRFLRNIWLECCGHLSGFKIGDTFYSSEPEDFYFLDAPVEEVEKDEGEEGGLDDVVNGEELLEDFPAEYVDRLPSDLRSELRKSWSIDDLVAFLRERLKSIRKGGIPHAPEEWNEFRSSYLERQLLESLLDMLEDRSLDVPLEKALKVGQKSSYEYDFGSTTPLKLKVVLEREGVVGDEPVEILARNTPPAILCIVCRQPATKVVPGYFNVEENAYCNKCAKKARKTSDWLLPVVNSPRVGVCGYTGRG